MPSNSVADGIHTKTHCSRLSSTEVPFLEKTAIFRFWAPSKDGHRTLFILGSLKSA